MQAEGIDIKQYSFSSISKRTKGDKVIWTLVVLLTLVSLLAVYSSTGTLAYKLSKSTESYLFKQIVFIAIGVAIIYFAHLVNYTFYSKVAQILYHFNSFASLHIVFRNKSE
jgi:cell division protein FtsW